MATTTIDEEWPLEHRVLYAPVLKAIQTKVSWQMAKPHLREASSSSIRRVAIDAIVPTRKPGRGKRGDKTVKHQIFTQYDLVMPCADAQRADARQFYTDIVVARSDHLFNSHTATHWVVYSGLSRADYHRTEDIFGAKLDAEHVFCGVSPSLQMSSDSDGSDYRMVLSSGLKTRYAPLEEAKARQQRKRAKALRKMQQERDRREQEEEEEEEEDDDDREEKDND